MYKKINKRWGWRVFKRNRVQILSLSVILTAVMFIKMTFMMDYADLVLLVLAQLLRFLIWCLMLLNFIRSATELVSDQALIKFTIRCLKIIIYIGTVVYIAYAISVIVAQRINHEDIVTCKNREFIVQSSLLLLIMAIFIYFGFNVSK